MRSDEFWGLTWYEWGGWVGRIQAEHRKREQDHQLTIEMTRNFMALFANANRGKDSEIYKPQDFFKLSYDKPEEQKKELTEEDKKQAVEKAKEVFKARKKKRNG